MTANDPLRPRSRPGGVRVEAEAATWESTVFAVSIGVTVRYLEVPAEQVAIFLAAVDAGQLDGELADVAGTATGATRDRPGRVRGIVAFDRVLRSALSRAERDPATGQLVEPGSRQRKRQRDVDAAARGDQGSTASGSFAPGGAAVTVSAAAGAGVAAVASRSWWSSPVVAVGAVVAVVVVVAGTVFAVTRPADESATAAAAAVSAGATASQSASASVAAGSAPGGSATVASEPAPSGSAGSTPGSAAASAPGSNNQFAGTYSFTRTVTENSGNTDFPIGTTDSGSVILTAACDEPTCAIDGDQFGVPTISGNQLAFAGTAPGTCPVDAGITVQLGYTVTLDAAPPGPVGGVPRVGAMQGVGTLTVTDPAGCDAEIQPITYSYELTRTG